MNTNKDTIEQIKQEINDFLTYAEVEEVEKYSINNAKNKRNNYFEEKYNRVLVLKKELFVDGKYTRSINLGKLLANISDNQFFLNSDFLEKEEKKKEEFNIIKKELEKEIDYLNNNNQKEQTKKYLEAITLSKIENKIELSSDVKIGTIIEFGNYPYDESGTIKPIQWKVLDVKDNKALLITNEAVDCKRFNEEFTSVTWETCTLRRWLNNEFYNTAFNDDEKEQINLTDVNAYENPKFNTNQGNNTKDKVFLLNIQEMEKYFKKAKERKCVPTGYAIKKGAWVKNGYKVNEKGICWWWLRSSGDISRTAAYVYAGGSLSCYGNFVLNGYIAVRPALWLNL